MAELLRYFAVVFYWAAMPFALLAWLGGYVWRALHDGAAAGWNDAEHGAEFWRDLW